MTGSRVFAAVTADDLRRWRAGEPVDLTGRPAHAVTDRARQAFPDDDEEELEYAAQWSAVERAQAGAGPVVVAALDVPAGQAAPSGGDDPDRGFEVRLAHPVPATRLAALHVLPAAAKPDEELSWYDAAELPQVLELLG